MASLQAFNFRIDNGTMPNMLQNSAVEYWPIYPLPQFQGLNPEEYP